MHVEGSPGCSVLRNLPAGAGLIPGLGRSPGSGNGNPLLFAWETPLTEEPDKLQSMGAQRVRYDQVTEHVHTHSPILAEETPYESDDLLKQKLESSQL